MGELRRFLTQASEELQRNRGAIDQLCAGRQQLSPHPHLQDWFMGAMRAALAWHCLRDLSLAQACLAANCAPRSLRLYQDLTTLPRLEAQLHSQDREARDVRRWTRVALNCLCDLGWSRPHRDHLKDWPEALRRGADGLSVCGRCSEGSWHLPRVLRWQGDRYFSPCCSSRSQLSWATDAIVHQGLCPCGRSGQWEIGPFTNS